MRLLATKNKLPLSVLIRFGIQEEGSHVIAGFWGSTAIHSNLVGVRLEYLPYLLKQHTIVKELDLPLKPQYEREVYNSILSVAYKNDYDIPGLLFWAYRIILKRLFGRPLPVKNLWSKDGLYLCTGIVAAAPAWLIGETCQKEFEMKTPLAVLEVIEERFKAGLLKEYCL